MLKSLSVNSAYGRTGTLNKPTQRASVKQPAPHLSTPIFYGVLNKAELKALPNLEATTVNDFNTHARTATPEIRFEQCVAAVSTIHSKRFNTEVKGRQKPYHPFNLETASPWRNDWLSACLTIGACFNGAVVNPSITREQLSQLFKAEDAPMVKLAVDEALQIYMHYEAQQPAEQHGTSQAVKATPSNDGIANTASSVAASAPTHQPQSAPPTSKKMVELPQCKRMLTDLQRPNMVVVPPTQLQDPTVLQVKVEVLDDSTLTTVTHKWQQETLWLLKAAATLRKVLKDKKGLTEEQDKFLRNVYSQTVEKIYLAVEHVPLQTLQECFPNPDELNVLLYFRNKHQKKHLKTQQLEDEFHENERQLDKLAFKNMNPRSPANGSRFVDVGMAGVLGLLSAGMFGFQGWAISQANMTALNKAHCQQHPVPKENQAQKDKTASNSWTAPLSTTPRCYMANGGRSDVKDVLIADTKAQSQKDLALGPLWAFLGPASAGSGFFLLRALGIFRSRKSKD
jgi:hypothetical protein